MHKTHFCFLAITASLMLVSFSQPTSAQTIVMDTKCSTCQDISNYDQLEVLKNKIPVVIWTNSILYDKNSKINVNGHSNLASEQPITLRVTDENGKVVGVSQVHPDSTGAFSASFDTSSELWTVPGNYVILAQGISGESQDFRIQVTILPYVGSEFVAKFVSDGATVTDVQTDFVSKNLLIKLSDSDNGGIIEVHIPRSVLDAVLSPQKTTGMAASSMEVQQTIQRDDQFKVQVDGNVIEKAKDNDAMIEFTENIVGTYFEKKILDNRILLVPFEPNSKEISISGNFMPLSVVSDETASSSLMSGDGTVTIFVDSGAPKANSFLPVEIRFIATQSQRLIEHINYDLRIFQNEKIIFSQDGVYDKDGINRHITPPLDSDLPIDVQITLQGIGINPPFQGPIGDTLTVQIVPEFSTIALLVLLVSITVLVILSKKFPQITPSVKF